MFIECGGSRERLWGHSFDSRYHVRQRTGPSGRTAAAKLGFHRCANPRNDRLLRWGAWKIRVGPDHPSPKALKIREFFVRGRDDPRWVHGRVIQQKNGARFGVSVEIDSQDYYVLHSRLLAK